MAKRLTLYILAGLVLGLIVGLVLNTWLDDGSPAAQVRLTEIAGYFSILTSIFLRLIKMIIAPLVFATLVSGIAQMGDTAALGPVTQQVQDRQDTSDAEQRRRRDHRRHVDLAPVRVERREQRGWPDIEERHRHRHREHGHRVDEAADRADLRPRLHDPQVAEHDQERQQ